ncbi:hypothetical protein ACO0K0_05670 [Undibacterium sp. SXout11W]|uniref:hypothetical protein n=1 Tax=Undibacterium sp. SXout11W TaxID=3413050 RepID=UPI003BF4332A
MRISTFSGITLLAIIAASALTSGCAVYVPPPRAYVVAPTPVVVVPGWGYGHRRW